MSTVSETHEVVRINARDTDAFDIANLRHYIGPNPYIDCEALVFDFALTGQPLPASSERLQRGVAERLGLFAGFESSADGVEHYAAIFAHTVSQVGRLDMGLHLDRWAVEPKDGFCRVAVQTLHKRTQWEVVYFTWDWFEAINQREPFSFDDRFEALQEEFGGSVYGGPSTYSLLRAAYRRGIPTNYLWDEGLMQYGYGRKQLRGVSTTFDRDSQLDSDFTCRKDDCKSFLEEFGYPVPKGEVVNGLSGALEAAEEIGYPVVVKPLAGHKGIGVTANITGPDDLEFACKKAVESLRRGVPKKLIVESFVRGYDYRLLCVAGEFCAAVKREPASIVGDGKSTIAELIDLENERPERADTPTSPLGKILTDDVMNNYLAEQKLRPQSVVDENERVHLRKVANLSLGGVSRNVTDAVHPDTIALCRNVAQHFRLVCLGIDVLTDDIAHSWKEGNFGIIEINAAPGIFMHLNPAEGQPVDVPSRIIETFFSTPADAIIPILTFNRLSKVELRRILDFVLQTNLKINPGGVCQESAYMRREELPMHKDYNSNIRKLMRNPRMDLLVTECPESVYASEGQYYEGIRLLVLDDPSDLERRMTSNLSEDGVVMIREGNEVTIQRGSESETHVLAIGDEFTSFYVREIKLICESVSD